MSEPISGASSSFYEPSGPGGFDTCDPSISSCPPLAEAASAGPVTIPPVIIIGDIGSGARSLVARHDALNAQSCRTAQSNAALSCLLATSAAGGIVIAAPTGIGLAMGLLTTGGLAAQCSRDVLAMLDCQDASDRRASASADCSSQGGVLLAAASGEPVCLVTR